MEDVYSDVATIAFLLRTIVYFRHDVIGVSNENCSEFAAKTLKNIKIQNLKKGADLLRELGISTKHRSMYFEFLLPQRRQTRRAFAGLH